MDENRIIDTPYNDRYCGNCLHKQATKSDTYFECATNKCYVGYNRWCPIWEPEHRIYKFEN